MDIEHMSSRINKIFNNVFLEDGPVEDCISIRGLTSVFALSKSKLEEYREDIKNFLDVLHDNFKLSVGGGWTFMYMPFTKDGEQWGEQPNAQQLLVLALGLHLMCYTSKPDMWIAFPGSLPYVAIVDEEKEGLYYGEC